MVQQQALQDFARRWPQPSLTRRTLSTGELLCVPSLTAPERKRLLRMERKLARAKRGSTAVGA
jgi:hypothetical protein